MYIAIRRGDGNEDENILIPVNGSNQVFKSTADGFFKGVTDLKYFDTTRNGWLRKLLFLYFSARNICCFHDEPTYIYNHFIQEIKK